MRSRSRSKQNVIGDRVEDILGTEKLEAEEKLKFAKEVNSYFRGVGRFAMNQNDENSPWIIFENIERIGKKAVERKLEEIAYRAALSLSILGNTAVRERFENLAQQAVIRLFELGKTAIDSEIKNAVSIVRFLSVIRRLFYIKV